MAESRYGVRERVILGLTPSAATGVTPRREYWCSFIKAGRVKRADQAPADWLLPADVIAAAAPLFDARPCYLDHPDLVAPGPDGARHQEPKVRHLVGVTFDPVWDPETGTLMGKLRLYDAAPGSPGYFAGALLDQILADRARGLAAPPIGLSAVFFHTAHLDTATGLRITDSIAYVESVDLVYDPGAAGYVLAPLGPGMDPEPPSAVILTSHQKGDPMTPNPSTIEASASDPGQPASCPPSASEGPRASCPPSDPGPRASCPPSAATPALCSPSASEGPRASCPPSDPGPRASCPPSADPPSATTPPSLVELGARVVTMQAEVSRLTGLLAQQASLGTVQGMADPRGGTTPAFRARTGLDQLEVAVEAMLSGTRPAGDVAPLTGIRELYTLLSGDYEMTGRYNPDRVYLANVTSSTMAGLVANALNKRVVNLYASYPKWWEPAVTEEDFTTLQQVKWITLGGIGELPTVAEGAAYTELTWDDNTETASFVKKGGYLGLTIEAIDKDDTNRLRAAPRALAQGAWMTLGKTIAALFTAGSGEGPTLADGATAFNTTRGNKGSSAFSHSAWVATKIAMMKATELNSGERLAALTKPHLIWVPVDLEDSAVAELASGEGQIGSANYDVNAGALANALTDRLQRARERVIVCPFWTDATDWAAQADPRLYPGLGLGYRYGRAPEIFSVASPTAGLMFTNDTMPVKVRFFFATGITDWRAWYRQVVSG